MRSALLAVANSSNISNNQGPSSVTIGPRDRFRERSRLPESSLTAISMQEYECHGVGVLRRSAVCLTLFVSGQLRWAPSGCSRTHVLITSCTYRSLITYQMVGRIEEKLIGERAAAFAGEVRPPNSPARRSPAAERSRTERRNATSGIVLLS
jgi:hypothetical protein